MSQDNRLDIKVRFRVSASTPNGVLLKFLQKQEPTGFARELLLKAARAFWLAEAYRDCGGKRGAELKMLAQNMVFILEDQADSIRAMFNLERPKLINVPVNTIDFQHSNQASLDAGEDSNAWDLVSQFDTGGL